MKRSNLWHCNALEGKGLLQKEHCIFFLILFIYLCLSNMEVLIVVVNDSIFRTTSSDETNALFPK